MALTLAEATRLGWFGDRHVLEELTREDAPWIEDIHRDAAIWWASLSWHKRLRIRVRTWIVAHTPHAHVYLGEHPRDEDS